MWIPDDAVLDVQISRVSRAYKGARKKWVYTQLATLKARDVPKEIALEKTVRYTATVRLEDGWIVEWKNLTKHS